MITTCETKRFLRFCRRPAVAVCQYCGRSFCDAHGGRQADGQEICSRDRCQQKKADLVRHLAYREAVAERNRERRCGEPNCRSGGGGQCSKCNGLFCLAHLQQEDLEERQGYSRVVRRASLCRHCRQRRGLWARV